MTSREIRQQFIDFFVSQGHAFVPSSPVVPLDDPTLMFTNAGMNQFKPIFLGSERAAQPRVANSQKCIRAGGKHNDLDDVGHDTYHHTFFEMLGNWSFGDYFKKEAIQWAWELLTKVWGIDKSRLHATYFGGLAKGQKSPGDEATGWHAHAQRGHEAAGVESAEGGGYAGRPADIEWELEPDYEARDLWTSVTDIDPSHVHPGSMKDNFWEMGDTGPCGPCSEIHVDLTPDKSGAALVNKGDARVIEIWNLVFIQFNRAADGALTPLPAKHVDTGMGFERLCAVLQGMAAGRLGAFSNYDTDVFTPIFEAIRRRTKAPKYAGTLPGRVENSEYRIQNSSQASPVAAQPPTDAQPSAVMTDVSYRVIADHLRCLTFALTDGAVPSNEGRGYVLRRILRRAVRYGRQYLNMHEPFLCDLVPVVVEHMGDVFPELRTAHNGKNPQRVQELIRDEEASFLKTLDRGIKLFNEAADYARTHHDGKISGEDAFKLHDTYGFPIDLTELMAEEQGLTIDLGGYERLMEEARERARGSTAASSELTLVVSGISGPCTDSLKYAYPPSCNAQITASMRRDSEIHFATDRTCFYTEQGGQVADTGWVTTAGGRGRVTRAVRSGVSIIHIAETTGGNITAGPCELEVDTIHRWPTMQNHTATHILNWALREVLEMGGGGEVAQKGSLVDPEKTRFDFSHNAPLAEGELARIEELCMDQIRRGLPVYAAMRDEDFVDKLAAERIKTLRRVFGEKYPDRVRVVSIGASIDELLADPQNPKWMQYSVEFCGGTHVKNTAEIEAFTLISEEGVAKGVRRVVGISGEAARRALALGDELLAAARALQSRDRSGADSEPRASARAAGWHGHAQRGHEASETESDEATLDAARQGQAPRRSDKQPATDERLSPSGASLADRLAAFQKQLADAVIPLRVRHQIRDILAEVQKKLKESEKLAAKDAGAAVMERVASLLAEARTLGGVTVVVGEVPTAPVDALRTAIDWVRQKTAGSAVLLACVDEGKVTLLAGMSKTAVDRGLKAGDLIKEIAPLVGGKGGGRPDMAQGGGTDPSGLSRGLDRTLALLQERLA